MCNIEVAERNNCFIDSHEKAIHSKNDLSSVNTLTSVSGRWCVNQSSVFNDGPLSD